MSTVKNYLSLIRFSHTIFAMPFAMIGFALGVYQLSWHTMSGPEIVGKLVLVILCMIFARSAAMAFNRWLDVKWDAMNPRTAIREIPRGIISRNSALRFVAASSIAFIFCTWFINPL